MNYKTKQFDIKSVTDTGELVGYFSSYQPVADSYGDCVAPGCFTETIKAWAEKGKHIPLVWNHNMDDPELIIGQVDKIEDDEYGPLMTAHFYDTPKAQAARNLMREGSVYQFSYAYAIDAARKPDENEKAADPNINQVLEAVSLMEITITPTPAQPLAEMVSVKSEDPANQNAVMTEIKAGRRNSKKDADAIKEAITLLQGVLGELEEAEDPEDGEDEVKANGAPEEPEQSNPKKEQLLDYIKSLQEVET
ncbi:MAG: HK97 family phage prohead protease [Parasporobacterium sp.]|nr:HK97 family phage prohead protease [Parasporobacterium sp.]